MEPGDSMCIHKGTTINPILRQIKPITRIDNYFFKIHSNVVLPSTHRLFLLKC